MKQNLIHSAIFGFAVGDALGVPVEFKTREYLKANPVQEMFGFGTHNQPAGTWSDDTSMTLCTMEALIEGYDLQKIADSFVKWYKEGYWTAHGEVFDIGLTTRNAIRNLISGISPIESGLNDEYSNGNGSLMRILPIAFTLQNLNIQDKFKIINEISSITHSHMRSVLACLYYAEIAQNIINGASKFEAYKSATVAIKKLIDSPSKDLARQLKYMNADDIEPLSSIEIQIIKETINFRKLYSYHFPGINFDGIKSTGYVLDTLETVIACILSTNNYKDAILKAVNLGDDTDTIGALTGGLAGLLYSYDSIPKEWIEQLARKDDIFDLCNRFEKSL
jgi:ADP-ribosylglycohydrolase